MQQKPTSTTTKGLIIGLIMIAFSLITSFTGVRADSGIQWLGYGIFLIGIFMSISQYGKQVNYNSTFGNYFAHGFKVSAVVTLIMILFLIVFMTVFPEFKDKAMDEAKKGMAEQKISEEQMEQAMSMTKKFFMVFLIGGALLAYLVFGCIASLIGAAITKKDPRPIDDINQIGE